MKTQVKPADLIQQVSPATRPIVRAARSTIRSIAPRAEEVTYSGGRPRYKSMMWKLLRYRVNGESVVGMGTFTSHAAIFFPRGGELTDERGLLEGSGKSRYITLRAPADATRPAVERLVREAFALER